MNKLTDSQKIKAISLLISNLPLDPHRDVMYEVFDKIQNLVDFREFTYKIENGKEVIDTTRPIYSDEDLFIPQIINS